MYVVTDPDVMTVVRLMVRQLAARAGNDAAQRVRSVTSVPESSATAGSCRTGPG